MWGLTVGAIIGFGVALIPGLSAPHAFMATSFLTGGNVLAMFTSFCFCTLLNSAKEALTPNASGSVLVSAGAAPVTEEYDPKYVANSCLFGKIVGFILGVYFLWWGPLPTLPITWLVASIISFMLWANFMEHKWLIAGYLGLSQIFFWVAPHLGITNPVIVLGTVMFLIPGCIEELSQKRPLQVAGECYSVWPPDPIKLICGMFIAGLSPGISANLVTAATTAKTNAGTQITSAAAEAAIEGMGFMMLVHGFESGKSLLGMELSPGLPIETLWVAAICLVSAVALKNTVFRLYQALSKSGGCNFVALVVAASSVILGAGFIAGLLLILIGLITNYVLKSFAAPGTIRSLLFLGAIF